MKLTLTLILALVISLVALAPAQVDFRFMTRGIHIHDWRNTTFEQLKQIKAAGYDHVGTLHRAIPIGGVVQYTPFELLEMENFGWKARAAELRWLCRSETWNTENTKLFNSHANGSPLPVWNKHDEQAAGVMGKMDHRWVVFEPWSEPGFFTRDTDALNTRLTEKLGHADARKLASGFIMKEIERFVPMFRAKAPKVWLSLPGPGWGSPCGPGEWQDLNLAALAKRHRYIGYRMHFYGPREITHQSLPLVPYSWPDETGELNLNLPKRTWSAYEFGAQPWTRAGLRNNMAPMVAHFAKQNVKVFASEIGGLKESRDLPAFWNYFADMKAVCAELGISFHTEWRGPNDTPLGTSVASGG